MVYYKGFKHTNSSDDEETVLTIASTAEEPKRILGIGIIADTNGGYLRAYIEREKVIEEIPVGSINNQNYAYLELEIDLPVGQVFKLTLQNQVSGTNASIEGFVKYDITG